MEERRPTRLTSLYRVTVVRETCVRRCYRVRTTVLHYNPAMTIRILVFGELAAKLGVREVAVELADGARVADAIAELQRRHAPVRAISGKFAVAVNHAYVKADHTLAPGDEMAIIPPVSGG